MARMQLFVDYKEYAVAHPLHITEGGQPGGV